MRTLATIVVIVVIVILGAWALGWFGTDVAQDPVAIETEEGAATGAEGEAAVGAEEAPEVDVETVE